MVRLDEGFVFFDGERVWSEAAELEGPSERRLGGMLRANSAVNVSERGIWLGERKPCCVLVVSVL